MSEHKWDDGTPPSCKVCGQLADGRVRDVDCHGPRKSLHMREGFESEERLREVIPLCAAEGVGGRIVSTAVLVQLFADLDEQRLRAERAEQAYATACAQRDEHRVYIKELEALVPRCKCGKVGGKMNPCPYALELYGEEKTCGCCDDCRQSCAWDV